MKGEERFLGMKNGPGKKSAGKTLRDRQRRRRWRLGCAIRRRRGLILGEDVDVSIALGVDGREVVIEKCRHDCSP
jgi:hypothetical protein